MNLNKIYIITFHNSFKYNNKFKLCIYIKYNKKFYFFTEPKIFRIIITDDDAIYKIDKNNKI